MRGAMPLPFWAVALVVATVAPAAAKMLAGLFERRARKRSRQILLPVTASTAGRSVGDTQRDEAQHAGSAVDVTSGSD
jgi:hypothetical protein